jgi:hypothetical protein
MGKDKKMKQSTENIIAKFRDQIIDEFFRQSGQCKIEASIETEQEFNTLASFLNKQGLKARVEKSGSYFAKKSTLIIEKNSVKDCRSIHTFIEELRIVSGLPTLAPSSISATASQASTSVSNNNNNNNLAQTSSANVDEQWQELLINLIRCVKRNNSGEVIGIDSNKRREILQKSLIETAEGFRFPNYIKKAGAGNIVITTKHAVASPTIKEDELTRLQNFPENIRNQIDNMHLAQCIRYDKNGNLIGRSLYGGLASANNTRYEAAVNNSAEKISKSAFGDSPAEITENQAQTIQRMGSYVASNAQALAYSIHDVSYLINSFLPKPQFLNDMMDAGKIDESTFLFYQQIFNNDQNKSLAFLQRDPNSLKLATSNTYYLNLDSTGTQEIFGRVADHVISDPFKDIKYQLEFRPLLSSLYPQDYFYAHEFYCGILPIIKRQLNEENAFKEALKIATINIINRILDNIEKGQFPKEISGLDPYEAADIWKDLTEINIIKFMRRYPGLQWDTLQEVLGLNYTSVSELTQELQTLWANERENIVRSIESAMRNNDIAINYRNDLIVGQPPDLTVYTTSAQTNINNPQASSDTQENTNQQRLEQAKLDALGQLIESNITFEHYNQPVLAVDGYVYDKATYENLEPKRSAYTRESFQNKPIFEFKSLTELITAHTENDQPKKMQALLKLCKDMITDKIMSDPVIVIFQSNDNNHPYFPKIMDRSTFEQLPYEFIVHTHRDFGELREVIQLMDKELKSTPSYDWNRLNPNYQPMPSVPQGAIARYTATTTRHMPQSTLFTNSPPPSYSTQSGYYSSSFYNFQNNPISYTAPALRPSSGG